MNCYYCSHRCGQLYWEDGHKDWCHSILHVTKKSRAINTVAHKSTHHIDAKVKRGERDALNDRDGDNDRRANYDMMDDEGILRQVKYRKSNLPIHGELYDIGEDALEVIMGFVSVCDLVHRISRVDKYLRDKVFDSPAIWEHRTLSIGDFSALCLYGRGPEYTTAFFPHSNKNTDILDSVKSQFIRLVTHNNIKKLKFCGVATCELLLPHVIEQIEELTIDKSPSESDDIDIMLPSDLYESRNATGKSCRLKKLDVCSGALIDMRQYNKGVIPYGLHILEICDCPHFSDLSVKIPETPLSSANFLRCLKDKYNLSKLNLYGNTNGLDLSYIDDKSLVSLQFGTGFGRGLEILKSSIRKEWMDSLRCISLDHISDDKAQDNGNNEAKTSRRYQHLPSLTELYLSRAEPGCEPFMQHVSKNLRKLSMDFSDSIIDRDLDTEIYSARMPNLESITLRSCHNISLMTKLLKKCHWGTVSRLSHLDIVINDRIRITRSDEGELLVPLPHMPRMKTLKMSGVKGSSVLLTHILAMTRSAEMKDLSIFNSRGWRDKWTPFFDHSGNITSYTGDISMVGQLPRSITSLKILRGDFNLELLGNFENLREWGTYEMEKSWYAPPRRKNLYHAMEPISHLHELKKMDYQVLLTVPQAAVNRGLNSLSSITDLELWVKLPMFSLLMEAINSSHSINYLANLRVNIENVGEPNSENSIPLSHCHYMTKKVDRSHIRFPSLDFASMVLCFLCMSFENCGRDWSLRHTIGMGNNVPRPYIDRTMHSNYLNFTLKPYFFDEEWVTIMQKPSWEFEITFYEEVIDRIVKHVATERIMGKVSNEIRNSMVKEGTRCFLGSFEGYRNAINKRGLRIRNNNNNNFEQ